MANLGRKPPLYGECLSVFYRASSANQYIDPATFSQNHLRVVFCFWLKASTQQYIGAAFLLALLCPFNAATRVCTPGVYDGGKACCGIDGFYV